ncbi:MAG: hybrid sensor histidine kinase/response regulator [Chitinophagaceae bacterium]|jgi:signal transduction histidine kinase|nr:MAG: hybrid sensor histidine kinase/response regulator [Chitinophagaceae bacterium]
MGQEKIRILYIDDEINNLHAFKANFRRKYEIYTASNTLEARKTLQSIPLHIIIADQRMPGATGVEFFNSIKENYPDPVRILLTGYTDIEALVDAINKGQIYRFIRKPWDDFELQNTISNAYEIFNTRKELERKMEELEKANDELSRFIYSASHDLRSPLMSVLGIINLSKLDHSITDPNGYVAMIEASVLKLDRFVQKIIEYYKNNRIQVEYEPIDFNVLIRESIAFARHQNDTIHFEVEVEQRADFYGDAFRISLILNNLISNAVKYQKPENEHQIVRLKVNANSHKAVIHIEDNGIGILSEHLNNIFKMFFRSRTNNMPGTGIGLYIVKEALDRIGGDITVSSVYEKGTTFIITIPDQHAER